MMDERHAQYTHFRWITRMHTTHTHRNRQANPGAKAVHKMHNFKKWILYFEQGPAVRSARTSPHKVHIHVNSNGIRYSATASPIVSL